VVVLKPDHVRDVDLFVRRYGARALGPSLFWRDDIPETELEPIEPGSKLPGGLLALYDGRARNETPLWLPEQRAVVFADALTAPGGELRVWATPWHEERALPALRALLELPFEHVIVSHGDPVHSRAVYERALKLPWQQPNEPMRRSHGEKGGTPICEARCLSGGSDIMDDPGT
jgi:glyoxylase-like metal-dependent hydrolase (beta-lactamase superfamily II)